MSGLEPIDLPAEPVSGEAAPPGWDGQLHGAVAALVRGRRAVAPGTMPTNPPVNNLPGPWDIGRYDDTTASVGARRGTAGYAHDARIIVMGPDQDRLANIAKATGETIEITETGYIYYVVDVGAGTATLANDAAIPDDTLVVVVGYVTFASGAILGLRGYSLPSVIVLFDVPGVKNSIEIDDGDLQLVGDEATPDNGDMYAKTSAGKGWKTIMQILELVTGYDDGKTQALIHVEGALQWEDIDDFECPTPGS